MNPPAVKITLIQCIRKTDCGSLIIIFGSVTAMNVAGAIRIFVYKIMVGPGLGLYLDGETVKLCRHDLNFTKK